MPDTAIVVCDRQCLVMTVTFICYLIATTLMTFTPHATYLHSSITAPYSAATRYLAIVFAHPTY